METQTTSFRALDSQDTLVLASGGRERAQLGGWGGCPGYQTSLKTKSSSPSPASFSLLPLLFFLLLLPLPLPLLLSHQLKRRLEGHINDEMARSLGDRKNIPMTLRSSEEPALLHLSP